MAQPHFYRTSHPLDVHLSSKTKSIQNLTDDILDEISNIIPIQSRSRSRWVFKKVLLNLLVSELSSDCIRYSRNKNDYGTHKRYGQSFTYNRLIDIMDALAALYYIDTVKGYWNKKKKQGEQTKVWASEKLLQKCVESLNGEYIELIDHEAPQQLMQLKDKNKQLIQYSETRAITKQRNELKQYNQFINEQDIAVELSTGVEVDNIFLIQNLLQGWLKGTISVNNISITEELKLYPDNFITSADTLLSLNLPSNNQIPLNTLYQEPSTIPTISFTPTSTNNIYPLILPSTPASTHYNNTITTITSTPISTHNNNTNTNQLPTNPIQTINNYTLPSITKEKRRRCPSDKPLQILNDFFQSLVSFNKNLKIMKHNIKDNPDYKKLKLFKCFWQFMNKPRPLDEYGINKLSLNLKYKSLHRVFNVSFGKGGRFYGAAHLGLPSHMRGWLQINGEPVVELDYDALHIKMLYHRKQLDITDDPYNMIEGDEERHIKKKVLLTAINAPDEKKAIKGIRKELIDSGITGGILKDAALKDLLHRAKKAHPLIADEINSGQGIILQNLDSKIASGILINLMHTGIPVLPVHDSFIVPERFEEELRQQMIQEYETMFNFTPTISKKNKKYKKRQKHIYCLS